MPNKTVPTATDVDAWLAGQPEARAADCRALIALMRQASGHPPVLWGKLVGFGHYRYVYESGRVGEIFEIGFASGAGGKGEISVYLTCTPAEREPLLARLGPHRSGKGCLYLKRLAGVDVAVLNELCEATLREVRSRHVPA